MEILKENNTTAFKAFLNDKLENEALAFLNSKTGGDDKLCNRLDVLNGLAVLKPSKRLCLILTTSRVFNRLKG